jgi:hypothetical protein
VSKSYWVMGAKYCKELHTFPIVFNAIANREFLFLKLVGLKNKCHVLYCMLNYNFSLNVFEVAFCLSIKFGVNKCHL